MLRFDVGAAELAGLIPREEDHAPGFFRVSLKHLVLPNTPGPLSLHQRRRPHRLISDPYTLKILRSTLWLQRPFVNNREARRFRVSVLVRRSAQSVDYG